MKKKIDNTQEILNVLKDNLNYLAADGGGIEVVKIDEKKGIIEIRMTGACSNCSFATLTFAKMIAQVLHSKLPWVKDVKLVN